MLAHTVTVNINPTGGRAKTVAIHGFGFAGMERIRDQRYYVGGGRAMTSMTPWAARWKLASTALSLTMPTLRLRSTRFSCRLRRCSDSVILTLFSTHDPQPTRMRVTELDLHAQMSGR
jgi:hypothetical protein